MSQDEDISDYPDDFEEAEDDDLAEVVSSAIEAMNCVSQNDCFDVELLELKDADGFSVTMKMLREKYMGKCAEITFFLMCVIFVLIHIKSMFSFLKLQKMLESQFMRK